LPERVRSSEGLGVILDERPIDSPEVVLLYECRRWRGDEQTPEGTDSWPVRDDVADAFADVSSLAGLLRFANSAIGNEEVNQSNNDCERKSDLRRPGSGRNGKPQRNGQTEKS
jgi:hypothetical protein